MSANTSKGITYPQSTDNTRLWEWLQTLATTADSIIIGNVNRQIFTANGTWTRPTNTIIVRVQVQAAGGGSGGVAATSAGQGACAPGAGGGEYAEGWFLPSATGATQAVTVGAGGTPGIAGNNAGNNGGNSSFGTLITAVGGTGGAGSPVTSSSNSLGGANGGTGGTGGDFRIAGGDGGNGQVVSQVPLKYNNGGSAFLGAMRRSTGIAASGSGGFDGYSYGGGASGPSAGASQSAVAGSNGAPGIVIVTAFTA